MNAVNTVKLELARKVVDFENHFGLKFPRAYREFLLTQGTAQIAGYTILGIPEREEAEEAETTDIIPEPPKPAKPPALSKLSASSRLPFPGFIKTEKRQEDRQVEKLKPQTEKREYSVVEATEFLHKKRPELKDRKLIPVCFKANRSTGKLMALCMDLSQEPKDDAPLVQISDVDDEHSEQASHDPEFFSEWMAHLKMLEGRHKFFKIAFQRVSNRNNEVLKKHLLKFFEKEFGQKCPLCRSRERRVIVFSKTQGRKTLLVCEECENEWSQLKGRKPELVEWVQEKLESKFNLPSFTEKGMRVVRGEEKKAKTIHLEKHDWRTRVFRVTDYIVGLTSFRYNTLQSCLEVDAFWSGDLAGYEKGQAIRNLAIAILSEASALTGSLALAFTEDIRESEKTGKVMQRGWRKIAERLPELQKQEAEKSYGRIRCPVPQELVKLAGRYGFNLGQTHDGIISHQEGLEIFWAALSWPEHLQAKVDGLEEKGYLTKQALANVIYSGIWTLQEAIWLFENSPRPEAVLLGSDIPEDRLYYTESLHWGRSAYLANLLKIKVSADLADGLSVEEREESDCELEPCEGFWTLKAVRDFNLPWMIKGSNLVQVKANEPVLILSIPCQTTKEVNDLEVLKSGFKDLKDAKSKAEIRCLLVGFEFSDLKYGMKVSEEMKENSRKLAEKGVYLLFSPYRLDLLNDEVENKMASARKKRQFPARKTCLHLQLFEIQKERWQKPDLLYSVEDAKSAAYWIYNKVDLRLGRIRFRVNCNCIERIAVQDGQTKCIGEATGQNSKTLLVAMTSESGITCPFILPDEMPEFIKKTKGILAKRKGINSGIVAVVVPDHLSAEETIEPSPLMDRTCSIGSGFRFKVDPNDIDSSAYAINRPEEIARTHQQIQAALKSGQPLAVSYLRHEIFVEAIREYLFYDVSYDVETTYEERRILFFTERVKHEKKVETRNPAEPIKLRIIYNDGTEGQPFPLFSLTNRPLTDKLDGLFQMKVGSISMRHVALDSVTDGYLLQNIMVSKRKLSSAEQEDYAFRRTWWFLSNFVDLVQHKRVEEITREIRFRYLWHVLGLKDKKSKGCELHIFQTGLVPATVGIYRATVKFLQERRGELVVVPRLIGKKAGVAEEKTVAAAYLKATEWF